MSLYLNYVEIIGTLPSGFSPSKFGLQCIVYTSCLSGPGVLLEVVSVPLGFYSPAFKRAALTENFFTVFCDCCVYYTHFFF